MAFSLVPAVPFTPGVSPLPGSVANVWRGYFASSLDADGGGDYANTVLIKFTSGSAGWEFDCPVTIGTDGTLSIDGGAAEIASGSTLTVQSGAFLTVDSGGTVTFLSGADMAVDSGATVTLAGTETVTGTMHFTSAGTWIMEGAGNITSTSIVTVDVAGKLDIGFGGFLRHQSSGTISHASGSTETHASGSTDTYSSGSVVDDGSTRTRTGPETRSGSGAYTADRATAVGPDSNTTIDATSRPMTVCPTLTASRTWTLGDPGFGGSIQHTITRRCDSAATFVLNINDHTGTALATIGFDTGATNMQYSYTAIWNGSNWIPKTWAVYEDPLALSAGPIRL